MLLASELFSDPFVALDGDYDGDGAVDGDDYLAWLAEYNARGEDQSGPLYADGNGDGVVDAADYALWRDNFGARWDDGWAALAAAVPEPAAGLLVLSAAALVARRRVAR